MGVLGKDLFRIDKSFFEVTVRFGNVSYEIEEHTYRYGELITDFLNYDSTEYENFAEQLQAVRKTKDEELEGRLKSVIAQMPLYRELVKGEPIHHSADLPQSYFDVADDLRLIHDAYAKLLTELCETESGHKKIQYAKLLERTCRSPFITGRSLGTSLFRDPPAIQVSYEVRPAIKDGEPTLYETFVFHTLADLIYVELFKAMMYGSCPWRCKNCGRWFLRERNTLFEYCGHVAPGETSKTCRDVGATASFSAKVKNNPVWQIHQRAYKKYYARVLKKNMSKADFNLWAQEAEALRDRTLAEQERAAARQEKYPLEQYQQKLNRL